MATLDDEGGVQLIAGQPISLVGGPLALRGELVVANTEARREVVRTQLLVDDEDGKLRAHRTHRLKAFSLLPNETRTVPIKFRLDRHTPPGEYRAQVDVAGSPYDAVVSVLAVPKLRITPRTIVVANVPDGPTAATIVVRNQGNVALEISDIGGVPLEDDVLACRILRRALAEFDETEDTYEDFLTETVRQAKRTLEEIRPLRAHVVGSPIVVEPGRTQPVQLEITVPTKLQRRGGYVGSTRLHGARLAFVVVPADRTVSAAPADHDLDTPPKTRRRNASEETEQ